MPARSCLLILVPLLYCVPGLCQTIRGDVVDADKKPLAGVKIENVYTTLEITSGEQGAFIIAAAKGQLLEFNKPGYKTARVRIPQGYIPPYFRIIMQKGIQEIKDVNIASNRYDPRDDSLRYYELYKHELEFPKLTTFEAMHHPFSALSGKNREIWKFQDTYIQNEQDKYVDRTFNQRIITKVTGLKGDSLTTYMRRFRPTYDQLRGMNDYAFYNFIKTTVKTYRNRNTPRNAQ